MKPFALLLPLFLLVPPARAGNSRGEVSQRCRADSGGATLHSGDFSWNMTLPAIRAKETEVYRSKRLPKRAYWDDKTGTLRLPYEADRGGDVELPLRFVRSVARHIERAFELDIVDAVIFPDMGHSHFLIPLELWEGRYKGYPTEKMGTLYADMMGDPRIEVFYHTAEQLRMRGEDGNLVDDERVRMRYRTRNISGKNDDSTDLRTHQNPSSNANTAGEIAGYYWWGAGFNVSANQDGCFEYRRDGKSYFFDLSLYDLEPEPGSATSDY